MTRPPLRLTALAVALLWVCPGTMTRVEAATPQKRAAQKNGPAAKPRPTPARSGSRASTARARATPTPPPSKPDRSLFQAAEKAEKALRASARLKAKRAEWEKVSSAYRTVVDRYPRSPYCDDCLLYTSPSPRDRTRSRMPSSA